MPSDSQRERIDQIIADHHLAFRVEVLGAGSIPKKDLARLVKAGIVKMPTRATAGRSMVSVPAMYQLGALAAQTSEESVSKLSNTEFWKYIKAAPPKLTDHELAAIKATKRSIGDHIQRLGQKVSTAYGVAFHEEGSKRRRGSMLNSVRREIAEGIYDRKSAQVVASKLKKVTQEAGRDWLRVAQTEMHNAFEEGKAHVILDAAKGEDPTVFKRPRHDACVYCKLLYLDGAVPRLFKLSELIANGTTNEGRRARRPTFKGANATEYKPVLGAVHPWCACTLFVMPSGFSFDKTGNMVFRGVRKSVSESTHGLDSEVLKALINHECQ